MKKKSFIIISLSLVVLSAIAWTNQEQFVDIGQKHNFTQKIIYALLKQAHYKSVELNDTFSKKAFNAYIENLDPNKVFLISQDVKSLEAYQYQIDDEFQQENPSPLYQTSIDIWKQRINEMEIYVEGALKTPFDFNREEFIETDIKKKGYANSLGELKERWYKRLKYSSLIRYANRVKQNDKKEEGDRKTEEELEAEVREGVLKSEKNYFKYLKKMDSEDLSARYFNSILSIYDPHTTFFPPEDKENFDINITGQLEGIGATLQQSDSRIKVVTIFPGGAAWKQKELKVGDVILKVAQGDEGVPVSVTDMSIKSAVKLIRGKKGTKVILTVEKPDQSIHKIAIIRDVVIMEAAHLKMGVVESKDNHKFGYITLPSFYFDLKQSGARSCYQDVKDAVLELQARGVEGIAIDLRSNGGGSLHEVIQMTGLFVDARPVVQVRNRSLSSDVLKSDVKKIYDGPLVVMISKVSASASEIFTGALQDYKRAIIVGGKSTFGKGTVQRIISIDNHVNRAYSQFSPIGAVKLTSQKFYRVSGKTTQLEGVKADVILPNMYQHLEIGESYTKHPLAFDEINPAIKPQSDYPKYDEIVKRSQERVEKNKVFQKINEYAQILENRKDKSSVPLRYTDYVQRTQEYEEETKPYKDLSLAQEDWKLEVAELDRPSTYPDSVRVKLLKTWSENVQKDIQIQEAVNVLSDIVELKSGSVAYRNGKNR